MPKYRMTLSYDGSDFCGWQIQENSPTIQGMLEAVLERCTSAKTRVIGSGRTDAGVHANGQVAHFTLPHAIDPKTLLKMLNGNLPHTIRVKDLCAAPQNFHAQISATRKIYHYHLWLDGPVDPFLRLYRYRPPYPLSLPLLEEAARLFVGTHDFTTFANLGTKTKSSVRTLSKLDVVTQTGGVRLEFEGNGFLYKMVRNIVGTLLEVARGKRPLDDIPRLLAAKDRRAAGVAAPPQGLIMVQVDYADVEKSES